MKPSAAKLLISQRAARDLRTLTKRNASLKKQLRKAIEQIRDAPLVGDKMKYLPDDLKGRIYKYRSGNYRIIYSIEDRYIIILRIFHRALEYDKIMAWLRKFKKEDL